MKEYEKRVKYTGIKPSLVAHDSAFLQECYGLLPTKDGLRAYKQIPLKEGLQYFGTADTYVVATGLACNVCAASTGAVLDTLLYTSPDRLSFVDYQDYCLLGNASFFAIKYGNILDEYKKATIPQAACYTNFNGQLLAGGITSDWHGCGRNSVAWAAVRTDNFDAFPEAGWLHFNNNKVLWLQQIGNRIIVYGDTYITSLILYDIGFGEKPVFSFGLANPYAVAGDTTTHVFINTLGQVWKYSQNGEYVNLDYSYLFSPYLSEVRVVYRAQYDDFYLTVPSLQRSYVLTSEGLGEANQCVLACSGLTGVGSPSIANVFRLLTTDFQFSQTSQDTLREIELQGNYRIARCTTYAHYVNRTARLRSIPLTHSHTVVPLATANSFQVLVEGELFDDIQLNTFLYRYFLSDRHHIRGASDVV